MTSNKSPLELIEENCNDTDTLHAAVPTGREDEKLFVLTIREQEGDSGPLLHERYAVVDLAAETMEWGSEGIVRRMTPALPQALTQAYARTTNALKASEEWDPHVGTALGASDEAQEAAEKLLTTPLGQPATDEEDTNGRGKERPSPGAEGHWSEWEDADPEQRPDRTKTVECIKCERSVPQEATVALKMGKTTMYRCKSCEDTEGVE